MSADKPIRLHIYAYQVGFGDCFLLRFVYKSGEKRHVLIDFGSMGMRKGDVAKDRMLAIAQDIAEKCEDDGLHVVVATHRHADHISGFATKPDGSGSGDIIASLRPKLVLQPWTEQLDLPEDATAPVGTALKGAHSAAMALNSMNALADGVVKLVDTEDHHLPAGLAARLGFLGRDNTKNLPAVENLASMGQKNAYAYFGVEGVLGDLLPGVKTHVLGPPTIEQTKTIRKQRARDPDEFWHFQRRRFATEASASTAEGDPFPQQPSIRGTRLPMSTRWIAKRVIQARGDQLLSIVTALDKAMNNTSLILLFEVGKKKLLFPGDAQIENWAYALQQEDVLGMLASVDVYKVGHHGSLNATPKTLWNSFAKRGREGKKDRLTTVLSTMPDKHGDESRKTEVPRRSLLQALSEETHLHNTHDMEPEALYREVKIRL